MRYFYSGPPINEFLYQGTNSKHPSVLVLVRNPVTTVFCSATNCDVGLTIVSDLRCSNPDSIKRLLTSLNCAQRLHAPCIHVAYVIVDRISQALLFASGAFKPHGRVRVSQTTPESCVHVVRMNAWFRFRLNLCLPWQRSRLLYPWKI